MNKHESIFGRPHKYMTDSKGCMATPKDFMSGPQSSVIKNNTTEFSAKQPQNMPAYQMHEESGSVPRVPILTPNHHCGTDFSENKSFASHPAPDSLHTYNLYQQNNFYYPAPQHGQYFNPYHIPGAYYPQPPPFYAGPPPQYTYSGPQMFDSVPPSPRGYNHPGNQNN